MKNLKKYIIAIGAFAVMWSACKRDNHINVIKSTPSEYMANFDLRRLYRGNEVTLTKQTMSEAAYIRGQVVSDHSGGNLPQGLLFVQNSKNMGGGIDSLRGIAINIGNDAANYIPGDSVHIKIEGGTLKRVNGILQITGLTTANIEKKASGITPKVAFVTAVNIATTPERYESCLIRIYSCEFEPNIGVETVEGLKTFDDGTGNMRMNVGSNANFKTEFLPYSAIIQGLVIPTETREWQIRPRVKDDFTPTSLTVDASIPLGPTPVIITGFISDVLGGDGNYEYVQLMATQDLDFRQKSFSVIFCRNGGGLEPYAGTAPEEGWATGGNRSYKFNLTRGTVAKGTFFYVGGYKQINGSGSTSISNANWIVSKLYANEAGDDGIGLATTGLMPNSGNPAGIGVFTTTNVTPATAPIDAIFFGSSTSATSTNHVFKAASGGNPAYGYLIPNNDHYNQANGATPLFRWNTTINNNMFAHNTPTDNPQGTFMKLGGQYSVSTNTWTVKRARTPVSMVAAAALSQIETGAGIFVLLP